MKLISLDYFTLLLTTVAAAGASITGAASIAVAVAVNFGCYH